jgi:hypothetical protein
MVYGELENMDINELKTLLKEFYMNLRKQNGALYSRSSFVVSRQSLNRHLKSPAVGKTFDIIADSDFSDANTAFKAMSQHFGFLTISNHAVTLWQILLLCLCFFLINIR